MVDYLPGARGSLGGSNRRGGTDWTAADKARIVATVLRGGVPAAQVARSHGLAPSRVYNWISAVRAGRLVPAAGGLAVPRPSGTAMSFAEVVTSHAPSLPPSPRTASGGIVIEHGRVIIRVGPGADLDLVREVLRLAREAIP